MSQKSEDAWQRTESPWWQGRLKVTMLLADAAQVVAGKLYILGGGWSVMSPHPTHMAIALKIEVPWDKAEQEYNWELTLVDSDGRRVLHAEHGNRPIQHRGQFHVHRPAGAEPGIPIDFALVVDAGVLTLPPGRRYVWHFTVDGTADDSWQLGFTTRPSRS